MIGCWALLALVLPLTVPSLTEMTHRRPIAILPPDAPSSVAAKKISQAFHEAGSENVLIVLLTDDKGLGPADETVYRTLVDRLRHDTKDVVMLQDFLSTPPLHELLASKDGKAWILPIGLAGELGTPASYHAYTDVADIVQHTVAGSSLKTNLTGPASTVADLTDAGARDRTSIELAIAVLLLIILIVIYRNPIIMLLPLITISASLMTAQAVVSGVSVLTGLAVSNQMIVLLSAMIAGVGTDYAVFLISRYHDYVRIGSGSTQDASRAVRQALTSLGKVIAASAATVGITFLGMGFTKIGVFSTVGLALAIGIAVAFLAAVTLMPAILVLVGPRGWVAPRHDHTNAFWRRAGVRIVRCPVAYLSASMVILIALALCASLVRFNYDERKQLPASDQSSVGYAALERHFPVNQTIPEYLLIQSPHDLRTPRVLADMAELAQRVSQIPGIALVRGVTRPTGKPLEETSAAYQAGMVGKQLGSASHMISESTGDLNRLASGAGLLADKLSDVRTQVGQAVASINGLLDSLVSVQKMFGGGKALGEIDTAGKLVSSMRALGNTLGINFSTTMNNIDWVGAVVIALDASMLCDTNPICADARAQFHKLLTASEDGTLDNIANLWKQLGSTQSAQTVSATVSDLGRTLAAVNTSLRSLGLDNPSAMRSKMIGLQNGAHDLASASRQIADGVAELVDETKTMGTSLAWASAFLTEMGQDASQPSMAGFSMPPQLLNTEDFKKLAQTFISPDGHSVRYFIQTDLNPFSTAAMEQVNTILNVAKGAQPNTTLSDASIYLSGYTVTLRDTRDYYDRDLRLIVTITIIVVLLILMALLRSIIAPLYLVGSVVISYLSALGFGVLVFQVLLRQQLHWSVMGLTFVVLVAVGADYNMLLASRLRDELSHGVRASVIRTVRSTGGVITAAGLIFAVSMFGLLLASIGTVVQAGFILGSGILLDTFIVRTITVPAVAALLGRASWWPARPWQRRAAENDSIKKKTVFDAVTDASPESRS
ncbi:MMPL family RND transporter [Mycobacterium uberis]|uniref:MMPL family RND transporter n=1 Tax=Mycobacterium uberis TaxID=2162698 RepID=A0A3E1HDI8_9MYCO|nr:MMPL family RND transporter [Mycobacterium uberis]